MVIRCWTVLTLLVSIGCGSSDTSSVTQQKAQTRAADDDEKRTPKPAEQLPETVKGKSLPQWLNQLERGNVLERREAAKAMQEFDNYPGDEIVHKSNPVTGASEPTRAGETFVQALTRAISDADFQVRRDAAHLLGKLGSKAKAAEPALREALKDEEEAVREAAAQALKRINPGGDDKGGGR
jgi:HEAT repeat protein